MRYRERTTAERANTRLKDEFGGNHVWVRGATKVMSHLMFGVLVLSVDQFMRLLHKPGEPCGRKIPIALGNGEGSPIVENGFP